MTSSRLLFNCPGIVFIYIITMKTPGQRDKNYFKCHTVFFTKYNADDSKTWLEGLKATCDWVLGQEEICPSTGRVHIQGMAWSKEPARWGYIKEHKEKCFDPIKSIEYCTKEESRSAGPWELGARPSFNVKGQKLKNLELITGNLKTLIDEDRIPLLQLKRVLEARSLYANLKPIETQEKVIIGTWHYGPPRTGKSTAARTGVFYLKMANKWWDGYKGESKVVLEDVDISMKDWLGNFLKIWTDWWSFKGEIKGGVIDIQLKEFHVTSNYRIDEIWEDSKMVDAIQARFKNIHYSDPFNLNK